MHFLIEFETILDGARLWRKTPTFEESGKLSSAAPGVGEILDQVEIGVSRWINAPILSWRQALQAGETGVDDIRTNIMVHEPFTFIAAVNSRKILEENLLRSPDLGTGSAHQLLPKEGYASASLAYNAAIPEADNDLLIFIHQDVYLPAGWCSNVSKWIQELDNAYTPWGVLGCFGAKPGVPGSAGCVYSNGWGLQGSEIFGPEPVETLDEIVLITRKSFGLRFDALLPNFHMYGVDLCLLARDRGRGVFAIPAFCVHNTKQLLSLPDEFYQCYWYLKKKWRRYLPIHTSCIVVSRYDLDLRKRKARHLVDRFVGSAHKPIPRVDDPRTLLSGSQLHDPT